MQKILKYLRKADQDYNLIEDNDFIIVGVSGGKDSVLLLYALSIYQKFKEKNFKILGVHMNMGFPNAKIESVVKFTEKHDIPFVSIDVPIYEILQNYKKEDGSLDCSRCSNLKRGAIVNIAKEYKANKIAFAHHGDDAVETLFLNAIYSGKLDTFKPMIHYHDNNISFIRPLIYAKETIITQAVNKNEIPFEKSGCPKDGNSSRQSMKELLSEIYKITPNAHGNLIKMLSEENGIWNKR